MPMESSLRLPPRLTLYLSVSPILIGNHSMINTAGHEPESQFVTALRVLEAGEERPKDYTVTDSSTD